MPRKLIPNDHPAFSDGQLDMVVGWSRDQDMQVGIEARDGGDGQHHLVDVWYGDLSTRTEIGGKIIEWARRMGATIGQPYMDGTEYLHVRENTLEQVEKWLTDKGATWTVQKDGIITDGILRVSCFVHEGVTSAKPVMESSVILHYVDGNHFDVVTEEEFDLLMKAAVSGGWTVDANLCAEVGRMALDAVTGSSASGGIGLWWNPTRWMVNQFIKTLREARDGAFGKDA